MIHTNFNRVALLSIPYTVSMAKPGVRIINEELKRCMLCARARNLEVFNGNDKVPGIIFQLKLHHGRIMHFTILY